MVFKAFYFADKATREYKIFRNIFKMKLISLRVKEVTIHRAK